MEDAFARPAKQVLADFKVAAASGLTDAQVTESRKKHGSNCTWLGYLANSVILPLIPSLVFASFASNV
jgi:hypothetical protein